MKNNDILSALEAVLFASGEPVAVERLAGIFSLSADETEEHLSALSQLIEKRKGGIKLIRMGNNYQLCTRPEYSEYIKTALDLKRKTPLSQAAFEVLSVVAYNQPVTKSFIEQIRGVDCSGVINTLVEKELIEEKGRLELPGKPLLYGTTDTFMRCFSLTSLSDLPPLPKDELGDESAAEQISLSEEISPSDGDEN